MVFSFDIEDDMVRRWSRTGDDVTVDRDESYIPSVFVAAADEPRPGCGTDWRRIRT